MKEKLLNWINLALMVDVFVVFLGFGWFAVAVTGHSLGISLGLDLWYKLWQPVFNPAIAILITGAVLSGVISWIGKRFQPD
jgi:hypothetical protein